MSKKAVKKGRLYPSASQNKLKNPPRNSVPNHINQIEKLLVEK